MTKSLDKDAVLALSAQRAMLGAITPNLRAAYVKWDQRSIVLTLIIDGVVSDTDIDIAQTITTEILSDVPGECDGTREDVLRCDAPALFPKGNFGRCVFHRKE